MISLDTLNLYLFIFVIYISIIFGIFWIILYLRKKKFVFSNFSGEEKPITIIVPAHNEEKYLERCVESVESQNYDKKIHIIIVDDGSTDRTGKVADLLSKKYGNIKVIHQKNMGKAKSLNRALKYVKTDIVGFIDADSYMSKNVLSAMVKHMSGFDSVVSPMLPSKTNKLILRLQEIEYMVTAVSRKLSSIIGALFLTPGMAIYKTSVIKEVGGFSTTTLTEDLEMGLRLTENGYKIGYISNNFVYTECPETWKDFLKQRIRWTRGFIENIFHYKRMIFKKKHEHLGMFVLPMRVLSLFSTMVLYSLSAYDSILSFLRNIIDFVHTNYDISYYLYTRHITISVYSTIFFLMLTMSYLVIISMARKYTKRNIRLTDLIIFILIYPTINIMISIISFLMELFGAKRRW